MIIFYENRNNRHKTSLKYHSAVVLQNIKSIAFELWQLSLDRAGAMLRHLKVIAIELWELCSDKVKAMLLKVRAMLLIIKTIIYEEWE